MLIYMFNIFSLVINLKSNFWGLSLNTQSKGSNYQETLLLNIRKCSHTKGKDCRKHHSWTWRNIYTPKTAGNSLEHRGMFSVVFGVCEQFKSHYSFQSNKNKSWPRNCHWYVLICIGQTTVIVEIMETIKNCLEHVDLICFQGSYKDLWFPCILTYIPV